jgi:hypothetical protein
MILHFQNIDLDTNFLHPDVFRKLKLIRIIGKVGKIQSDLFIKIKSITIIKLDNLYLRSLIHENGIEWIKNYNKDVNYDLDNFTNQSIDYLANNMKYIDHNCFKSNDMYTPPLTDIFPDEDFCLYKDFPINQLIVVFENCREKEMFENRDTTKITCTYLWITRSYKVLINHVKNSSIPYKIMNMLLNSDDYKSISKCNFESRLELCNKSNFQAKSISTLYELKEAMIMTQSVINMLSYVLSIFGIVTNILIIVTISSKKSEKSFKGFKQYDYMRLNSICNCLILLIHLISWLNHCVYPFQVFCPLIRKTIIMQYFNMIVEGILMNALKFMNNFTYVGFAFNRISLIGKDHNKLTKFMCEISIVKYISVSFFISIGFSVIKFFDYEINSGLPFTTYPLSYEYFSFNYKENLNSVIFILNILTDIVYHFIFLFVILAIDVGMIVKLRQTLKEQLEKSKELYTKVQYEKKLNDNEAALNNARSMIILNTSLPMLLCLCFTYVLFTIG